MILLAFRKKKMESNKTSYKVYKYGGLYYAYTSKWQHLLRKMGFCVGEHLPKYDFEAKQFPLVDDSLCIQSTLNGDDDEEQW